MRILLDVPYGRSGGRRLPHGGPEDPMKTTRETGKLSHGWRFAGAVALGALFVAAAPGVAQHVNERPTGESGDWRWALRVPRRSTRTGSVVPPKIVHEGDLGPAILRLRDLGRREDGSKTRWAKKLPEAMKGWWVQGEPRLKKSDRKDLPITVMGNRYRCRH